MLHFTPSCLNFSLFFLILLFFGGGVYDSVCGMSKNVSIRYSKMYDDLVYIYTQNDSKCGNW